MGEVSWSREILQLMPAMPGQFAWYYFDDKGEPYSFPIIAWALVKETRTWKKDDGSDESESETVVHPLVQAENILEYGFGGGWDSPNDASNSIGLWACPADDDGLKKAIQAKRAQNERDRAEKGKTKA